MNKVLVSKQQFQNCLSQFIAKEGSGLNPMAYAAWEDGRLDTDKLYGLGASFDDDIVWLKELGFDKPKYTAFMNEFMFEVVKYTYYSNFYYVPDYVHSYCLSMMNSMIYRCADDSPEIWSYICRRCGLDESGYTGLVQLTRDGEDVVDIDEVGEVAVSISDNAALCFFTPLINDIQSLLKRMKLTDVDPHLSVCIEQLGDHYVFSVGQDIRHIIFEQAIKDNPEYLEKFYHPNGEVF